MHGGIALSRPLPYPRQIGTTGRMGMAMASPLLG
jgi:hypothetical protein